MHNTFLLITKDYKKHMLAAQAYFKRKIHEEIMQKIKDKVPNVLEGYTEEMKKQ